MPDNYNLCVKRLSSLTKKFSNNETLLTSYNEIIKDQLSKGIIEKVSYDNPEVGDVHYLPHRPVVRDQKLTTKVRMVFDASAPTSGIALNSCLHPGPSLTTSLFGTLLRFRTKQYAFISDIEKAFLQISLSEKDRDFVRFIWYDDTDNINSKNLDESKKAIYRLCRVLFGVTSSPFLHCKK